MTPMDVFVEEVRRIGWGWARVPGKNGGCDTDNKMVVIGAEWSDVEAGIVGLHELGHGHTLTRETMWARMVFLKEPDRKNPLVVDAYYAMVASETAAWAWAEGRMPPGFAEQFDAVKRISISSYFGNRE